jgi:hypothetical protein
LPGTGETISGVANNEAEEGERLNALFVGVLGRQGYNMRIMTCLSFVFCCLLAIILFRLRKNSQLDRSALFCADALAKVVLSNAPAKSRKASMNLNITTTAASHGDISKSLYNVFIATDVRWGNSDLSDIVPEHFHVFSEKFPEFKYFLIKYFARHFIEDDELYNNIIEQFDSLIRDFFHEKYSPDCPESENSFSDFLDLHSLKYKRCIPSHFDIFLKEDVSEFLKMSLLSMFHDMNVTIPAHGEGLYTETLHSLFLLYFDILDKVQVILDHPKTSTRHVK